MVAWHGRGDEAVAYVEAALHHAVTSGEGRMADYCDYAGSILYKGPGRHYAALGLALGLLERDRLAYDCWCCASCC